MSCSFVNVLVTVKKTVDNAESKRFFLNKGGKKKWSETRHNIDDFYYVRVAIWPGQRNQKLSQTIKQHWLKFHI